MANTIILKKSSTAAAVPAAGSLQPGELAVNLADKKLYTKTVGGTVIQLADGNATGGGITYVTKTANYTAADKDGILADTSAGSFTVTLPASPTAGMQVIVADSKDTWATNNLTIARNGSTIEGLAEDLTCNLSGVSVQLVYSGTTWQIYTSAAVGAGAGIQPQNPQSSNYTLALTDAGKHIYSSNTGAQTITIPTNASVAFQIGSVVRVINKGTNGAVISASGVTLYMTGSSTALSGSYKISPGGDVTFTKVGTDTWWVNGVIEPNVYTASYLVVAGGGSGSGSAGGGGGAGGMLTGTSTLNPGTTYTVTVGGGGSVNANGSDSSALSVTATGGGYGSDGGAGAGANGGSGGGGGWVNQAGGTGTAGQGSNGGNGAYFSNAVPQFWVGGGGGGGKSAAGQNATSSTNYAKGGNGGAGLASSITGTSVTYAGGGGGCGTSAIGTGGAGGGGNGGLNGGAGTDGAVNTGGGGGGGWVSKAGGSGVVIISVPTANYSGITTGSPTVTTSGSDTILKFTSSGSYTA